MPLLNTITTPYAEAFLQVAESKDEIDQVSLEGKVYQRVQADERQHH